MILSFYRSKSHSFQNPGFPGFLFSATQCEEFAPLERRLVIDGAALISAD